MNPQEFAEKWSKSELKETASYVSHFEDVCRLMEHPTPIEKDPKGESFTYQAGVKKESGKQGFADVWYDEHFAIEYKGKGKSLADAYQQLLQYREALNNPPLLVVTDFDQWEAVGIQHRCILAISPPDWMICIGRWMKRCVAPTGGTWRYWGMKRQCSRRCWGRIYDGQRQIKSDSSALFLSGVGDGRVGATCSAVQAY